ncbi:MAG: hypothetical protein ACKPBU_00530 [Alphaproteobacteria bacterium]
MELGNDDVLADVLRRLPVEKFLRSGARLAEVDRDWNLAVEEQPTRLVARRRGDGRETVVRMPVGHPRRPYVVVADGREVDVVFREGFGGNVAIFAQVVFDLEENGARVGGVRHFTDTTVFGRSGSSCQSLTVLRIEDREYFVFRSSQRQSWLRVRPWSSTLDGSYREVATIVADERGLFSRGCLAKTAPSVHALLAGLLVAAHRGLVSRGY